MKRDPIASVAEASPASAPAERWPLPPPMPGFAGLAARLCRTPFASIVLTGSGESWCAADGSAPPGGVPRHDPFLEHTLRAPGVFDVRDAARDKRFREAELVRGPLAVRGYAGCALRTAQGEVLGALAVYDPAVRRFSVEQRTLLCEVAQQVADVAALRSRVAELELLGTAPAATAASSGAAAPDSALARALIESAPVAIYHANAATDLHYCNPAYRQMFGLRPEQSANDWAQGVHPEDRAGIEAIWADFCRRPRAMTFEYRAQQGAGPVRYFAEQVVPTTGVDGFVGTISDFTDLVNARGELHKAETLFRNTFDQAPIGIAYADRDGKFLRLNEAFCTLLGYTAAELTEMSIRRLTHAADAAADASRLERLWKGEVQFLDVEKRYLRKDGSYLWVRTTTALVRDGGRAECSVEYLRDISQRKALGEQLMQQQTLLEAVVTDLPLALLVADVAGNITLHNRAAVDLYAIPTQDGTTSDLYPLRADVYLTDGVTPVAREERPLARALRGETVSNLELIVAPRGGAPHMTLSNARQLIGPEGQMLGAVAVIQDVTERKEHEVELERVNKELVTASREAGMAEVATNVLHNVGNILNSVNISASLVAERIRQSKTAGIVRLASLLQEQGARAGQFIAEDERGKRVPEYLAALGEQLQADQRAALEELTLLRENLEHIKDTVTMQQSYAKLCGVTETVEVVDLVEDSLRLNAGAFARHGVALKREFADVPRINVDKHKVLQILVNLVRNAKYACDDSGRTDKLITLRIEPSSLGVRISVIDNGIGISPENMAKLFQHGFTTRASGHGFGLHSGAIAAQELGGTLRAESEGAGRGAAFILELPASPPQSSRA